MQNWHNPPFEVSRYMAPDSGLGGGANWRATRSDTPIDVNFLDRRADVLAKDLIGRILVTTINGETTSGVITETAAYTGIGDPKSYAYKVKKDSPPITWGPGSLQIYSVMGQVMLTVTAAPHRDGATVLIRALEPIEGFDAMATRSPKAAADKITIGPGNLSKALGITVDHNGFNILTPNAEISILSGFAVPAEQVRAARRKEDSGADAPLLRFSRVGSEWVSK